MAELKFGPTSVWSVSPGTLERVGAVCADREQELEQELVGDNAFRVRGAPVLTAHLAELAGPVGHDERRSVIVESRIGGALGPVPSDVGEPSPRELVLPARVVAERLGGEVRA